MLLATQANLEKAADHLKKHDPVLAPIIDRAGLASLEPHTDYYGALVNSIIGQQLSVKAAAAIKQRLRDMFDGELPSPEQILETDPEALRAIGFSRPKAGYIHDLTQHIVDGRIHFRDIPNQSNEVIISELTDVKGVGEWTVHMFLMFCVGRLDVLPVGDLGIRNSMRKLYGFKDLPTPDQIREVAEKNKWHPYESVASWYVWHLLDNEPA